MEEQWLRYASVYAVSTVKFLFGPLTAASLKVPFLPSALLTASGMMTTVLLLTFLGSEVRHKLMARFSKNRKLFSPRTRRMVRIWRKYGSWGVAMLTPVFFSPIIGTLIAISFGEHRRLIVWRMLVAATFWGFVLSAGFAYLGDTFRAIFGG